MPTTVKVWMPPLAIEMQKKNRRLRRIGALSSSSSPTLDSALLGPIGLRTTRGRMLPATIIISAEQTDMPAATRKAPCQCHIAAHASIRPGATPEPT